MRSEARESSSEVVEARVESLRAWRVLLWRWLAAWRARRVLSLSDLMAGEVGVEIDGVWLVMLLAGLGWADEERPSEGRVLVVVLEERCDMEGCRRAAMGKGLLLSGGVCVVGRWLLVGIAGWIGCCCCEMGMPGLSIEADQRVVGSIVSGRGA